MASAFNQESDKTNHYISMSTKNKWTVEESNLRRAGLQPAALPSELTVLIRRYKIAFPSFFSPYFLFFFSIRVPVPSASVRKVLTRLRHKLTPGACSETKKKPPAWISLRKRFKVFLIIICNAIPAHIPDINASTVAYSTHIFVLHNR